MQQRSGAPPPTVGERRPYKIRVEEKDSPPIEHPNDAIVRVILAAICGSDLHLSEIVTHRIPLDDIADGYYMFSAKLDGWPRTG